MRACRAPGGAGFPAVPKSDRADLGVDLSCLSDVEKSSANTLSQDNLFHSILGLFDVQTSAYVQTMDIFSKCRFMLTP